MEHLPAWLSGGLIFLGAAVAAVPLSKALGMGSIIGYLAAGIAIGPWGLRLVTDPQAILQFAEFGVVLMLFLVGLELEPKRLWALRGPIFGWGSVQLIGSTAVMAAVGLAFGLDWRRRCGTPWPCSCGPVLSRPRTPILLCQFNERFVTEQLIVK